MIDISAFWGIMKTRNSAGEGKVGHADACGKGVLLCAFTIAEVWSAPWRGGD